MWQYSRLGLDSGGDDEKQVCFRSRTQRTCPNGFNDGREGKITRNDYLRFLD